MFFRQKADGQECPSYTRQIRCPHCHNPIDVVNDDPSGDVSCPSCGSYFNLDLPTDRSVNGI